MRKSARLIIFLVTAMSALLSIQVGGASAAPKMTSSTKVLAISAEIQLIPVDPVSGRRDGTACYNTLQGEVIGTGFGPVGGPFTLAYVDATWSSGVNCVPSQMRFLSSTSALYFNNKPTAYSVEDQCDGYLATCQSVLSPGYHRCTAGTACAGNYNISGNHEMILFAPDYWASYSDNCWLGDDMQRWLVCVTASGDVTVPPVW